MVRRSALAIVLAGLLLPTASAHSQESCRRVVVFTLPGVTWADVRDYRPPNLLEVAEEGAIGSVSVRTIASRTSYSSGYATLGGGVRLDGAPVTGLPVDLGSDAGVLARNAKVGGLEELRLRAEDAGYGAVPGALGSALGDRPMVAIGNSDLGQPTPTPAGAGRWTLLAAMRAGGIVPLSATSTELITAAPDWPFGVRTDPVAIREAIDAALDIECASLVVDPGDLTRADQLADLEFGERPADVRRALIAADDLLGYVRAGMDPERDLLLVVSPTSPAVAPAAHLGVAAAAGPGWEAGSSLESASTRRRGIVTLPDVAPTVLQYLGIETPSTMNGRPWIDAPAVDADRIAAAVDLDDEAVFVDSLKASVSAWFVLGQVAVYVLALGLLARRESKGRSAGTVLAPALELAALALAAFPVATFSGGTVKAHEMGSFGYILLVLGVDGLLVVTAWLLGKRPLDRLLVLTAFTLAVMVVDLVTGARLQLNTVFGYSPIVAGRFAGAGNIAFAILGASTVLTGALIVHRIRSGRALAGVAALFAGIVVVDGAPPFGSDVGGVIALVPALAVTWVLLSGRRSNARVVVLAALGVMVALAAFAAFDLSRPPASRTHLGRLVEDLRARGGEVLVDTVRRKASANLRVFRSTIWTLFVPPALATMAYFLARPRGRWRSLAETFPKVRAGLVGGLLVAVLGFAVNDSGIVVPAVVLSFLVPMALLVHLVIEMEGGAPGPVLGEKGEPNLQSAGAGP